MKQRLFALFETAQERWIQFQESAVGKRLLTGLRWSFMVAILAYLAYQFTDIGWGRVWQSLPTTPWFYILLLLMYINLPIAEVAIYGPAPRPAPEARA